MGAGTPLPYLQAWRTKRGLSGKQLALRSGVVAETIWALERGDNGAHSSTIELLAQALHISVETLIRERPGRPARTNPPITPATIRFALDWYRRVK